MHLPEAQELGVLQSRDHPQHALLFAEAHVILESHQVEAARARVFAAKLHHGVGPAAGARIGQSHRLHRPEAQRVASAPRDLFDRQAGFEVVDAILS